MDQAHSANLPCMAGLMVCASVGPQTGPWENGQIAGSHAVPVALSVIIAADGSGVLNSKRSMVGRIARSGPWRGEET